MFAKAGFELQYSLGPTLHTNNDVDKMKQNKTVWLTPTLPTSSYRKKATKRFDD